MKYGGWLVVRMVRAFQSYYHKHAPKLAIKTIIKVAHKLLRKISNSNQWHTLSNRVDTIRSDAGSHSHEPDYK
jgi:hypothetical protein